MIRSKIGRYGSDRYVEKRRFWEYSVEMNARINRAVRSEKSSDGVHLVLSVPPINGFAILDRVVL